MLLNINYKGKLTVGIEDLDYGVYKPQQCVLRYPEYTIVVFRSGSCRVMGCKTELDISRLPLPIKIEKIQSVTISFSYSQKINLFKLKEMDISCSYEPELFPALRISEFNPLCVNVFATGKIVVMGLKSLQYQEVVDNIFFYLDLFTC